MKNIFFLPVLRGSVRFRTRNSLKREVYRIQYSSGFPLLCQTVGLGRVRIELLAIQVREQGLIPLLPLHAKDFPKNQLNLATRHRQTRWDPRPPLR